MSNETKRRDFIGMSFGAVAAVGGAVSLVGMKKAWDPLPSVLAAGFIKIDLAGIGLEPGKPQTYKWRGKPIFVLLKTADMKDFDGDLVLGDKRYTIVEGLCTHLGCIPAWKKDIWKCACHGGEFNANGEETFGPPPKPLVVPPFSVEGSVLTLGEASEQSNAMQKARA
ncbi:MAG: ubiquinol-cytochrome c reductase iron-sulfur subunit [Epsilonproteobacteria bacterium]|nr:MAG: ubiquinol-cytochrome c reductase iron-sulfur subunit [Campylobacterota bacterium]